MRLPIAISILLNFAVCGTDAFVPNSARFSHRTNSITSILIASEVNNGNRRPIFGGFKPRRSMKLFDKLWERMEIEEDEEPQWYVLNCVAGLEMDLLRLCRQRCDGMEDVEKFVVPTVTTTRSHGANRMVQDTKVKYQGYVFAKLRLCEATYEAISDLDLCRSWMGTINMKGMRKLPPAPVILNEEEIENFGLESIPFTEEDEDYMEAPEGEGSIIVDTEERDKKMNRLEEAAIKKANDMEEEVQKVYKGFRVDDMIKVTANNNFLGEDGIVKRLKGGQLMIRFFTYGATFDEWLDPGDVRKLSNEEVLRGLGGPQQPITQRDFDGPRDGGDRDRRQSSRESGRRNLVGGLGADPRSRRQERTAQRFRQVDEREERRERENWRNYQDNERRSQGGAYQDGELEMRGSKDWVEGDIDSQWGRGPQQSGREQQRQNRREKNKPARKQDDWSSFVTPAQSRPAQDETDDFFSSLMADLSNDLDADKKGDTVGNVGGSDEDDFFASLMSEMEDERKEKSSSASQPNSEDDFFASLEADIRGGTKSNEKKPTAGPLDTSDDLENFFADLGAFDDDDSGSQEPSMDGGVDDFFAGLEAELESELSFEPTKVEDSSHDDVLGNVIENVSHHPEPAATKAPNARAKEKKSKAPAPPSSAGSLDADSLNKCTVPVLKGMLKERGLKVSGKKAELIERLTA